VRKSWLGVVGALPPTPNVEVVERTSWTLRNVRDAETTVFPISRKSPAPAVAIIVDVIPEFAHDAVENVWVPAVALYAYTLFWREAMGMKYPPFAESWRIDV